MNGVDALIPLVDATALVGEVNVNVVQPLVGELQGGHHVPDSVVRRRFASGRRNFDRIYRDLVDAWALYDNSGAEPVLMDWREKP